MIIDGAVKQATGAKYRLEPTWTGLIDPQPADHSLDAGTGASRTGTVSRRGRSVRPPGGLAGGTDNPYNYDAVLVQPCTIDPEVRCLRV
ncbi:MAG: hypothetical protein U0163_07565 [Gemmatimonadaceae bacterium]